MARSPSPHGHDPSADRGPHHGRGRGRDLPRGRELAGRTIDIGRLPHLPRRAAGTAPSREPWGGSSNTPA
ncbi:MAG: hypothetical protein MZV64_11940 [Ignavibacteriales bacterium]|nr:hypothetical protein [Ignavibacteriales bacterium]